MHQDLESNKAVPKNVENPVQIQSITHNNCIYWNLLHFLHCDEGMLQHMKETTTTVESVLNAVEYESKLSSLETVGRVNCRVEQ